MLTLTLKKLTALATIAALAATVNGQWAFDCLNNGVAGTCAPFVDSFCDSVGTVSVRPFDNVSRCFNAESGVKCDFTTFYDSPLNSTEAGRPSVDACKQIGRIITSLCPRGGAERVTGVRGFQFYIDANVGPCTSNSVNSNPS
ncbi:hypothetical protein FA15DRAFT_720457 [Coprinopsis marcescibilis]|uniref:Glycan binding protein Y3-like domain-containing protein n=1 Tax=Coprinopsis marcescibilis TaxID=230819 RepID=A0A5C3KKP3_COPMA|nr:hypothetical protein FA15DRAFT_720457 [Coprinopsis marcescibilis]